MVSVVLISVLVDFVLQITVTLQKQFRIRSSIDSGGYV